MNIIETPIKDLLIIEPRVFNDDRGYFFESYSGLKTPQLENPWVQDNESKSSKGVLRGLHYQVGEYAQAKLVRAVVGEIYDVAVDIRPDSKTYGQSYGILLSDANKKQLLIPRGFAHGFLVLSNTAIFAYKCDNYYSREHEGGIYYNDPQLKIEWPMNTDDLLLSEKDKVQPGFGNHLPFQS